MLITWSMAETDFANAPWHLVDGVLRNKVSGIRVTAPYWGGTLYNLKQVTQALTPKLQKIHRMTILSVGSSHYIKSKDGQLHSTRYRSREHAAEGARKIAAGLIHFAPLVEQITKANLSNPA